jgi:excisionase family DNA binding protein
MTTETKVEYNPLTSMVTLEEIADATRVSPITLARWVKQGKFPQPRRYGRRTLRWPADEVNAWIEKHNEDSNADR